MLFVSDRLATSRFADRSLPSTQQHRETEGRESPDFLGCFPKKGITYLDGGAASGFRAVADLEADNDTRHLYRVCKRPSEHATRCFQVPLRCSSLHHGDAFLLDAGDRIYTWFGDAVSAFEKSKSAQMAHNIRQHRLSFGSCECVLDVEDDDEEFWQLLGGKGEIKPAQDDAKSPSDPPVKKMVSLDARLEAGRVSPFEIFPALTPKCVTSPDAVCGVGCKRQHQSEGSPP